MIEDQTLDDGSPKSRVLRLFKFLFEVNRLRNRPERTLRERVLVIPLTQLPRATFMAQRARAPALFRDLAIARADGSLRSAFVRFVRIDVLVIDDWAVARSRKPNAATSGKSARIAIFWKKGSGALIGM